MKQKVFLVCAAIILGAISTFASSNALCINTTHHDEHQAIIIYQRPNQQSDAPRSTPTIEAYWDSAIHSVNVYLNNAGNEVTVDIVNNTTGESFQCLVSGNGWDCIPVMGLPGPRVITFTLETGTIYYGMFIK